MKSKFFCFFLILILGISFISSIEFTIKEEVVKGENLVVKVSGTFTKPLTKDNINFYRRHMSTSIEPYDIMNINGNYYIYAQIPFEKEPDNYSIHLEDIEYFNGIETSTEPVFANFTILNDVAPFSLTPGILEAEEDYSIKVTSLSDTTITVYYGVLKEEQINLEDEEVIVEEKKTFWETLFGKNIEELINETESLPLDDERSIQLKPGESKTIQFSIGTFTGFEKIRFRNDLDSYEVLAFVHGIERPEIVDEEEEENESEVKNESIPLNYTNEDGEIIVINKSELEDVNSSAFANNCSEVNGTICSEGQKCEGENKYTKTSLCCVGTCSDVKKSSTGKTIGWIMIVSIVLFLTWFFKNKYRGTKPDEIDLEKESKGKK